MATCFVIQPFDPDNDRRYEEIYKPAVTDAGLEPYRVDHDPTVEIPINSIEERIRNSTICLADITHNNPNVWYELGYAFALGRPVVMTCSDERSEKLPFDIQHRTVIKYLTKSLSDFHRLHTRVVEHLRGQLRQAETLQIVAEEQVAPQESLGPAEVIVLAVAAANIAPGASERDHRIRQGAERSGLTQAGFHVALRRLLKKGFLAFKDIPHADEEGNTWEERCIALNDSGWDWIDAHEERFSFIRREEQVEDDIPF